MANILDCKIIKFQTHKDDRGNLTVINEMPFEVRRVFYSYDIKGDRGGHAHKICKQFIVAINGGFTVELIDSDGDVLTVRLCDKTKGVYIPNGIWVNVKFATDNAVCLVMASERYDSHDYIYDIKEFLGGKK